MPVLHLTRAVVADPHSVVLVLETGHVVGLWPGAGELRTVDGVHHVTIDLPRRGPTRMEIGVTPPVDSGGSFLVGFVISGDLPPVAGAFRVTAEPGRTMLSLSLDHQRDVPSLHDLAEQFLAAIADRVENRAQDE